MDAPTNAPREVAGHVLGPVRLTWTSVGRALALSLLGLVLVAAFTFRDQVLRASLDPKEPFQTYRPPPAPDYSRRSAWALLPADPVRRAPSDPVADVFFVHPTTYNGGEEWNGPIDHARAVRQLDHVMTPNYAGPFSRAGVVFAPRYRQASLYAMLSLREDAQDARRFAYGDVKQAFSFYLDRYNQGRPFILVGVEQGGALAARLLREEIGAAPALLRRMAGAYLIQSVVPADAFGAGSPAPACSARSQARCVVAYMTVPQNQPGTARRVLERALVWGLGSELEPLAGRPSLCVNPLLGVATTAMAPEKDNLGAANATDLEWGLRPAFLPRQVSARCDGGLLLMSRPHSPTLKSSGGWADRLKAPGYNPFYADLDADARARVQALIRDPDFHLPAPPITTSIEVRRVPVMGRR